MYCASCGAANVEYALACVSCGLPLRTATSARGAPQRRARPVLGSAWSVAALVVIGGVVASVAVPAYREYAIRAEIDEGLALAAPHKAAIVAAWESSNHEFTNIYSGSLEADLKKQGKHVRAVDVVAGAIVITYGGAAHPRLQGRTLTIVPALDAAQRSVAWQCGRGPAPDGFEAIFDEPSRLTDVPDEYLPADCRGS